MKPLHSFADNIPMWVYNLLSLISALVALLSAGGSILFAFIKGIDQVNTVLVLIVVALVAVLLVLLLRLLKYRKLSRSRIKTTSVGLRTLASQSRDTFFDTQHSLKTGNLTVEYLTEKMKESLEKGLDSLCQIMTDFTGEEVSACVKIMENSEKEDGSIDIDSAKIRVFCRSSNSNPERLNYDHSSDRTDMYLKNDTALMLIVGEDKDQLDHFYQQDLDKFANDCQSAKRAYRCYTPDRSKYYNGVIILPIRIEFKRLYYYERDDAYHVIGFLCVDSLSKNTFQPKQEIFNCDVVRGFAAEFYVLLSQYRHYLKKLKDARKERGV